MSLLLSIVTYIDSRLNKTRISSKDIRGHRRIICSKKLILFVGGLIMNLEELQLDCAIKQKKGLHFILASIIIWCTILIIHLT